MITPIEFEEDFIKFLEKKVSPKFKLKGFDEKNKKEVYKNPKVTRGFILPKINGETDISECPYICFRITKLETKKIDGKNIHCLNTVIAFGCYCIGMRAAEKCFDVAKDGSGYRDLWNIMDYTRQSLFNGTYNPKVRLFEDTFSMEVPQEQYYPIWEGYIKADFLIGVPEWEFRRK